MDSKSTLFQKIKKIFWKPFSLIELLIVIAIMGALAALILPHFTQSESAAKDTVCDYNQAGTVRFINMFNTANGAYPTGFHTGYWTAGEALGDDYRTEPTATNMGASTALTDTTTKFITSLKAAGITTLADGTGTASTISTSTKVCQITATSTDWYEDATETTPTKTVTINGRTLPEILNGSTDIIVPLFAAPTIDWDKAYVGGETKVDSKVSVPLVGKCPWPADGTLRYYICFFRVYADGSAAKLIGSACPECGVLNAGTF